MGISVCMMVKNEETNLPRCLESVKDLADEIIVVDTGSVDRTVEIAKAYGAKIFHHPWEGNFSKHRNQSIDYASNDWVFIIDADEELHYLNGYDPKQVKADFENTPNDVTGIHMVFKDIKKGHCIMQTDTLRFFRKGSIRYEGIVHNKPLVDGKLGMHSGVFLHHYGSDLSPEKMQAKYHRTTELLWKSIEEDPNEHDAYYYLNQQYMLMGNLDKCIECGEEYIKRKEQLGKYFKFMIYFTMARAYMAKKDKDNAGRIIQMALGEDPQDIDICLVLTEFGIWVNNAAMARQGASNFVLSYNRILNDPKQKKGRFVFSFRPESLAYCVNVLAILNLQDSLLQYRNLRNILPALSDEFRANLLRGVRADLEHQGCGVIFKNIFDPSDGGQ